ncbi:MAG: aldo/keto reductase [Spirochaetales bacterium]|nr:aldo/keto reductase [Spirochaetales bacterium]
MEKRILGKSGLSVTELGVGLWAIGGGTWGDVDDRDSLNMIDAALDQGINFYDTADVYGGGHSEEVLGKAMKGRRDRFILATKIGWINFDGEKSRSAYDTVKKLTDGVKSNLKRLDTDHIDLIQDHIDFREPNMEIFIEGFELLRREGLIREYGISSSDFSYIREFCTTAPHCTSLQIDYSILNRTPEADIFPFCRENNIGVIVRGALAMGILTGKFDRNVRFEESDFRNRWLDTPEENEIFLQDLENVEKLKPLAGDKTLAQLALQFVLANPAVTVAIPGAKTGKQLKMNVKTAELPALTEDDLAAINGIVPHGGGRKIWPA